MYRQGAIIAGAGTKRPGHRKLSVSNHEAERGCPHPPREQRRSRLRMRTSALRNRQLMDAPPSATDNSTRTRRTNSLDKTGMKYVLSRLQNVVVVLILLLAYPTAQAGEQRKSWSPDEAQKY